jgi:hypothetical protein
MAKKVFLVLGMLIISSLATCLSMVYAQSSRADFTSEPDQAMAAAQESFLKKDMNKAAEQIGKAADYVKKEADKVAKDAKGGVKKAGDELSRLGQDVKNGAVTSDDQLKKTYGKVDYALAKAWHETAGEAQQAGKDSSHALSKAGESLEGAAEWSGNKLEEGAQASVEAVKKVGKGSVKGVKAGSEEVDSWFKSIGQGIEELGRKL